MLQNVNMDYNDRCMLMYRIIKGRWLCSILNHKYCVCSPNIDILYKSQQLYNNIISKYKYETWLKKEDCLKCLVYNGLCTSDIKSQMDNIYKQMDNIKVQIYKSFFNSTQREMYRQQLTQLQEDVNDLENIYHSLDYLTLYGFASILQQQYIVYKTFLVKKRQPICGRFSKMNFNLLNVFNTYLTQNMVTNVQYRELARTEPWLTYWRVDKSQPFGKCGSNLTLEQRNLILYSKMYDNVYEHYEKPPLDIINDDDALDGWLLVQQQKNEEEKKDKLANDLLNVQPNAQEVFIPAHSSDDVSRINDLNTPASKIIKAQRKDVIKKMGIVNDGQLPDRQLDIRQQALKQFKGHIHGH